MVEKQSIIDLSSYSSKGYASEVLSDSEITFLGDWEDAAFCRFFFFFFFSFFHYCISLSFILLYFMEACSFSVFLGFFFLTVSSSSSINCPSLMFRSLLIIFLVVLSMTLRGFLNRLLKCSFHFCIFSSWLAAFSFALEVLFLLLT